MMDECGLPLKSIDTSSSVEYCRMPFSGPSAAAFRAALTSAPVVFLSTIAARSTTETFGVGTRIAKPSSLPFKSGSTSPTASATPVLVRQVEQLLIVCVRVDGGHPSLLDSKRLMQDLRKRRQAVRRARGI